MKTVWLLVGLLALSVQCWAWDGFDADSAELVEIATDAVPEPGESVLVKNYDQDSETRGVVESVRRNIRTIEVVVQYPDGSHHTLVMEGR